MRTRVERRTVNLFAYPDLVVIYLGMRVNRITGIKTLLGFGPKRNMESDPCCPRKSSTGSQEDCLNRF
jgi:hypothetical protein